MPRKSALGRTRDNSEVISMRINKDVAKVLKSRAEERGLSKSHYSAVIVENWVKSQFKKK